MKVNLDGLFKDVRRLVDAPVERSVKSPTEPRFHDILASVAPNRPASVNEINPLVEKPEVPPPVFDPTKETMARLNFSSPQLSAPEPDRVQGVIPQINPADENVKTPSLLHLRRIKKDVAYTSITGPSNLSAVKKLVEATSDEHGIDPALSLSIIENESSFNPNAVSGDGFESKGLMQLLDSTGTDIMERAGLKYDYNPFDPQQNVELGVQYLRHLHELFGQETPLPNSLKTFAAANSSSLEKLAVAAFNAGEGRVASAQQRAQRAGKDPSVYEQIEAYLPESTREYVTRVINAKAEYQVEKNHPEKPK